ncbi:hypothetical protein BH11BAC4_BH11BAC4_03060 [soil metagenome]
MKTLSFCAVLLFSMFTYNTSFAQVKNDTIKVWGNCGMCKTNIEKAAKSAGASTANWNEETKALTFSYALDKTSDLKIQQAIARSGYDTEDFTGDNKAYQKLHACCQYERKEAGATTDKKCCKDGATCKHGDKASCNMDKAACSKNESCKHDGNNTSCKDMACCKDKTCCGKTMAEN